MSGELKNCSYCQKSLEVKRREEKIKYYTLTLNKNYIACCENCWEKNKESYKSQLKTEWGKLEEWEKKDKYYNDKSYYIHVNVWTAAGVCTTSHLSHGKLCRECDKWCDDLENAGEDGGDPFCSPQHRFITKEKRELKGLQEQWKILKDFPENYPTRAETKKRKEELEKKYSKDNPQERERERERAFWTISPSTTSSPLLSKLIS